jgi:hypothetical protein
LPGLIDLYDAHAKDRDKFEILAFHDGTVKDFAELNKKLEQTRRRLWGGRDLPFPILLDATGQTIKDWDIHAFPTTLLIDPEGKLVGHAGEDQLGEKLPPLPIPRRVARNLDRVKVFYLNDFTLEETVRSLARASQVPIRLDPESLKRAGVAHDTRVLLKINAWLSLRSALHLILEADGLTYEQDEEGLVIRGRKPDAAPAEPPTKTQKTRARWIESALNLKVSLAFKEKSLDEVMQLLQDLSRETFVLDPVARKASQIDPKMLVTGSAKDVPLREALTKLLEPIGMGFIIRDEVIVFTAKKRTASGR